jgi:ribosome recycling factor
MDIDALLTTLKADMDQVIDHLKEEFSHIAAGKASPVMVENVMIDSYGTKMPLKGMATITIPEPQQIVIQPWDKSQMSAIEHALRESEMSFNPQNDGAVIRIYLPQPTEEKRKELVKIAHKKAEEGRVSLRTLRQELHNEIKKEKESSNITEDDYYQYVELLDKTVKDFNFSVDSLITHKESELLTI